jgi:hypothetical protein
VQTNVEDWKKTPWRKVDVENMDIECKKFAKEIRGNYVLFHPYFLKQISTTDMTYFCVCSET